MRLSCTAGQPQAWFGLLMVDLLVVLDILFGCKRGNL